MALVCAVAAGCLETGGDGLGGDTVAPTTSPGAADAATDLRSPTEIFFCGNGFCDPGEDAASCPSDCGPELGQVGMCVPPRLYFDGEKVDATLSCWWTGRGGWRLGAIPASSDLPYSAFVTSCPLDPFYSAIAASYRGRSARWTFALSRSAVVRIEAWIPDSTHACSDADGLSRGVTYFLHGPRGFVGSVEVSQAENMGRAVVLFPAATLSPGTYTLHLPDSTSGGCDCDATVPCADGLQSQRVFADGVCIHPQ